MAMQVQAEGTGYSVGENEANNMEQFLSDQSVSHTAIKKLISNGLDTIDHLKSIGDADIDDLCKECGIKTIQKIKLKTAIKKLKNKTPKPREPQNLAPILIDKEERIALTKMAEKVKAIESAINLVADTTKNIDAQIANHMNNIQTTFKELHESLDQRQQELIEKLKKIAYEKKEKLQNVSNALNQQHNASKQKLQECTERVSKPTEIHEINSRIAAISNIANEVNQITIVTKEDSVISCNKIFLLLQKALINKTINAFGAVTGGAVPILVSLTDNGDCTVGIEWKFHSKDSLQQKENNKLKIAWSESKSDDIQQFDEKWENNKEIELKNDENMSINISVDRKIANYFFQIQYFDGNEWSSKSKIKSVSIKHWTDSWDPNCKAGNLQISGNSIINTNDSSKSAYLSRVVSEGVHCWKFKIDKYSSGWQLIGVWKTKFDAVTNTYFENTLNQSYAFVLNDGYLSDPGKEGSLGQKYGKILQDGDIIEMTLNLNNHTLSYKINEADYGKAFDVEQTTYKAAVTLLSKDTKFTLLSYNTRL